MSDNCTHRKWRSFREALRSAFSPHDIERLELKLSALKNDLQLHFIYDIKEIMTNITANHSDQLSAIQSSIAAWSESLNNLRGDYAALFCETITDLKKLRSIILEGLSEAELHKVNQMMLNSLRYPQMRDRYEEISEAHAQTFKWILEDSESQTRTWSNFSNWLQNGTGIYWVNGKAGSGKSTLMRYIVDHQETRRLLKFWSANVDLHTAAFFFWNSGSAEQRSYIDVFPEEWAEDCSTLERSRATGSKFALADRQWTLLSLKRGFSKLADYLISGSNQCFFIDGLDECEGDHGSMLEFLKELAASSNIKFCLSSRPWLVFHDLLGPFSRLRLQDLTFNDISSYVTNKLERDSRMAKIAKDNVQSVLDLTTEIVSKADGVFLWVKLVVRSLLSGLQNRDDISVLRSRLQSFPSELEGFYAHMLNQIEPLYRHQAFEAFGMYDAMSQFMPSICGLEMEAAVTATIDNTLNCPVKDVEGDEIFKRGDHIEAYLKSRCAGLLELHGYENWRGADDSEALPDSAIGWKDVKVIYIHKTAKEFLDNDVSRMRLASTHKRSSDFDLHFRILMSFITRLKEGLVFDMDNVPPWICQDLDGDETNRLVASYRDDTVCDHAQSTLELASVLCEPTSPDYPTILDDFDQTMILASSGLVEDQHWSDDGPYGKCLEQQGCGFTGEADYNGIISYVSTTLQSDGSLINTGQTNQALLNCVLLPKPHVEKFQQCSRGVNYILRKRYSDKVEFSNQIKGVLLNWSEVFKMLLQYGASANTTCMENHVGSDSWGIPYLNSHHTVLDVIEHVFRKDVPEEAAELSRMVHESADGRTPLPNRPQQGSTEQSTGAKRVLELDENGDGERSKKRHSR
ncbi:hypothetical protein DL95DRAFT_460042 [Leptodontidium sp. 2 PMI_412]|nr:hypothetical protein DL95DRAFT_460042 [Leptodontidium sp. 2 PMI_412]